MLLIASVPDLCILFTYGIPKFDISDELSCQFHYKQMKTNIFWVSASRSDYNFAVQLQKLARVLKSLIYRNSIYYTITVANVGANQMQL